LVDFQRTTRSCISEDGTLKHLNTVVYQSHEIVQQSPYTVRSWTPKEKT
jgi:hypothetical protein